MSDVNVGGAPASSHTQNPVEIRYEGEGRVSYGGQSMSVMEAVSLLMLERSEVFTQLTRDKMKDSQDNLKQIKEARNWLAKFKESKNGAGDGTVKMSSEALEYLQRNKISRSGYMDVKAEEPGVPYYDKDQWDVNIQYVQAHLDKLTDSNQLEFLKLKSNVNKLDEAISAANKMYDKNDEAIKTILR